MNLYPSPYIFCEHHILPILLEEEEEEGGEQPTLLKGKNSLQDWWEQVQAKFRYPLYAIFLATSSDIEIVKLINEYRSEVSQMSGDRCCFLYFSELGQDNLSLTRIHMSYVIEFSRVLEIQFSSLPCLLFFEDLSSGQYVRISLINKNSYESLRILRQLFDFLNNREQYSIEALQNFEMAQKLQISRKVLFTNITKLGYSILESWVQSMLKIT